MPKRKIAKKKRKLRFRNIFKTGGVKQPANRIFSGPIHRDGITSVERAEQARFMKRMKEIGNSGMLKKMHEEGFMPTFNGVKMKDVTSDEMILPDGVTSMRNLQNNGFNKQELAKQIQRYNAGVYNTEEQKLRKMKDIMQLKQLSDARKALITWMATTDELDQIPTEYLEEVNEFYNENKDQGLKARVEQARERKKKAREEREHTARLVEGYWAESPFTNIGMPHAVENTVGSGAIKQRGVTDFGWAAPKLHTLIKPLHPIFPDEEPEKIIEDKNKALDERRDLYKEQQTFQRGIAPPKDMVERAMPKLATPIFIEQKSTPFYGIIPHDFVFPRKKYSFSTSGI